MTYYTRTYDFEERTKAKGEEVKQELDAIGSAFSTLPTPEQLFTGSQNYALDTGAANAYIVDLHASHSVIDGAEVRFKALNSSTGASTINVSGDGVKPLLYSNGTALTAEGVQAGSMVTVRYDGSSFLMVSQSSGFSRRETAIDVAITNADVVLTGLDVDTTNANVVITNNDVVLSHADVVLTGLDVNATHSDVILTGLDVITTAANVVLAEGWATAAAGSAAGVNLPSFIAGDEDKILHVKTDLTGYELRDLLPVATHYQIGINEVITVASGLTSQLVSIIPVASSPSISYDNVNWDDLGALGQQQTVTGSVYLRGWLDFGSPVTVNNAAVFSYGVSFLSGSLYVSRSNQVVKYTGANFDTLSQEDSVDFAYSIHESDGDMSVIERTGLMKTYSGGDLVTVPVEVSGFPPNPVASYFDGSNLHVLQREIENTNEHRALVYGDSGNKYYTYDRWLNAIVQYDMSTAHETATAAYSGHSFYINGTVNGISFNTAGTKVFIAISTKVYEHSLSTAWRISTMSAVGIEFDPVAQTSAAIIQGVIFNNDETKMFINTGTTLYEYTLSIGGDLSSTVSYVGSIANLGRDVSSFNATGTKLIFNQEGLLREATLGTGFTVSTLVDSGNSYTIINAPAGMSGVDLDNTGTKLICVGDGAVQELALSSSYGLQSVTGVTSLTSTEASSYVFKMAGKTPVITEQHDTGIYADIYSGMTIDGSSNHVIYSTSDAIVTVSGINSSAQLQSLSVNLPSFNPSDLGSASFKGIAYNTDDSEYYVLAYDIGNINQGTIFKLDGDMGAIVLGA